MKTQNMVFCNIISLYSIEDEKKRKDYSEFGRMQAYDFLKEWSTNYDVEKFLITRSEMSILYDIYKKFVCIPSSSASVERSFSIQGLVQTSVRNRLKPDTIANILTVRVNLAFMKRTSYYCDYLYWIHNSDILQEDSKDKYFS